MADLAAIASQAEGTKIQALLKERLVTLKELEKAIKAAYLTGKATFADLVQASALVLKAELELCSSDKERLAVHERAVALSKEHERAVAQRYDAGQATHATVLAATANRLEVEIAFERAKAEAARRAK